MLPRIRRRPHIEVLDGVPLLGQMVRLNARGRYDVEPDALVEERTGRPGEQLRFARRSSM
jgi:hypothetical protein